MFVCFLNKSWEVNKLNHLYLPFLMLFISSYRCQFLSGIILLWIEKYCLTFPAVHIGWKQIFKAFIYRKGPYFMLAWDISTRQGNLGWVFPSSSLDRSSHRRPHSIVWMWSQRAVMVLTRIQRSLFPWSSAVWLWCAEVGSFNIYSLWWLLNLLDL